MPRAVAALLAAVEAEVLAVWVHWPKLVVGAVLEIVAFI
jgi:hypothetical protein